MNWWLLWPVSGLLGWAWLNYMVTARPGGWWIWFNKLLFFALCIFGGPLAFGLGALETSNTLRMHRWGLRFW